MRSFDRYLVIWAGALNAVDIFLRREVSETEGDSGWFIGDLARLDAGRGEAPRDASRV